MAPPPTGPSEPFHSEARGQWPKNVYGLKWWEIPCAMPGDPGEWYNRKLRRNKKLLFGTPPDWMEGSYGHTYKVMRETWRRFQHRDKGETARIDLIIGGSWHSSGGPESSVKDWVPHLTFDFMPQQGSVRINGRQHGYPDDAINHDVQFRLEHKLPKKGKGEYTTKPSEGTVLPPSPPSLPRKNRCGERDWVPDPNHEHSLTEDPQVFADSVYELHSRNICTYEEAERRIARGPAGQDGSANPPKPLPSYPGLSHKCPEHIDNTDSDDSDEAPPQKTAAGSPPSQPHRRGSGGGPAMASSGGTLLTRKKSARPPRVRTQPPHGGETSQLGPWQEPFNPRTQGSNWRGPSTQGQWRNNRNSWRRNSQTLPSADPAGGTGGSGAAQAKGQLALSPGDRATPVHRGSGRAPYSVPVRISAKFNGSSPLRPHTITVSAY